MRIFAGDELHGAVVDLVSTAVELVEPLDAEREGPRQLVRELRSIIIGQLKGLREQALGADRQHAPMMTAGAGPVELLSTPVGAIKRWDAAPERERAFNLVALKGDELPARISPEHEREESRDARDPEDDGEQQDHERRISRWLARWRSQDSAWQLGHR